MVKARVKARLPQKRGKTADAGNLNRLRPTVGDAKLSKLLYTAKTGAGKRHIAAKEAQVNEPTKTLLVLKGHSTSQRSNDLLGDLFVWTKPHSVFPKRKQTKLITPLLDPSDFEYLGERNNASIFVLTSSTKKRPFRLFVGRLFNNKLFDLYEFDVLAYTKTVKPIKVPIKLESKPLVIFQGSIWDVSLDLAGAKNILADLFGGVKAEKVLLDGFDHVWFLTAYERHDPNLEKTFMDIKVDHFGLALKKGLTDPSLPRAELTNIGPSFTLRLSQTRLPDASLVKVAHRKPAELHLKKKKNVHTNDLLEQRAKVYINKEDFTALHTRHAHPEKYRKPRDMEEAAPADAEAAPGDAETAQEGLGTV